MPITTTYELQVVLDNTRTNTWATGEQLTPDAIGLSNGGYAVAYANDFSDGLVLVDFFDETGSVIGQYKIPYAGGTDLEGKPSITQLANGNVLVVWDEEETSNEGIKGQLFTMEGTKEGTELALAGTSADFTAPDVTPLVGGGFVIAYSFAGNSFVRAYDNSGTQQGGFRPVEAFGSGTQVDTVVSALSDGGYAVAFVDNGTGFHRVYTRTYDADGTERSANPIALNTSGDATAPAIAVLSGGGYAIAYVDSSWANEGGTTGITLVIQDANGALIGSKIHVNDPTATGGRNEYDPAITVLENGFIVVTWSDPATPTDSDIIARVFDQSGNPVTIDGNSGDFPITQALSNDIASSVAAMLGGEFVTVWQDSTEDGSGGQITRKVNELTRKTVGTSQGERLKGDALVDDIKGKGGNDRLLGKGGDDFLRGGKGDDKLIGGAGADSIYGDKGDDKLKGGAGDDWLFGGKGNDKIKGGAGDDAFQFYKGWDKDRITDFENNTDTLRLDDNLWSGNKNVNKVLNQFGTQNGNDFVLDFGGGDILTIKDTTKGQLMNDVDIF